MIEVKKTYNGDKSTSALSGQLRIEEANSRMVLHDGSVYRMETGAFDDGTYGFKFSDPSGFLLFKTDGVTWFWYDKTTQKNVMQVGKLPDGSYGIAVAKPGSDVSDGVF